MTRPAQQPRFTKCRPRYEAMYARRNILHAKSVGALENAKAALRRLEQQKSPPKWLVLDLEGIVERLKPVADEMAKHRDESWRRERGR